MGNINYCNYSGQKRGCLILLTLGYVPYGKSFPSKEGPRFLYPCTRMFLEGASVKEVIENNPVSIDRRVDRIVVVASHGGVWFHCL